MDLATAVDLTLLDTKPVKVRTGVKGPIIIGGENVGALLIGRSSATMNGLQILVGLIDKDYTGEIYVMVSAMFPPMHIPQGTRIAQLIPLPHLAESLAPKDTKYRGQGALGSTGKVALLTLDLQQRPQQKVTMSFMGEKIPIEALLDTGADVSIVSSRKWPYRWPTFESFSTVTGLGGMTGARRSPVLQWTISDKVVQCSVRVLPLPDGVQALIGRDILAQLGMILTSDYHHPL